MDFITRHINMVTFLQARSIKESKLKALQDHEKLRKIYLKIQQEILLKKELAIKKEEELRQLEASNEKKLYVI